MADTVKERVFTQLALLLESIVPENGFRTRILKVYREEQSPGLIEQFPAIIISQGRDQNLTGQGARRTFGLMEKKVVVFLDCFLYSQDTLQQDIRKLEADIEELIYRDRYTTQIGYTLNGAAFECNIIDTDPFGTVAEKPNGGVTVQLSISYHQKDTNAEQQA